MSRRSKNEGATLDELVDALKETLHRRGTLGQIRSSLRSEAFACLRLAENSNQAEKEDASSSSNNNNGNNPRPPMENVLINELIRDYLEFNGYRGTASVLVSEAGVADDGGRIDRELQKIELGLTEQERDGGRDSSNIPLLYGIVEALKSKKDDV